MILVRVIQHQTLKHWTSVWTQQGMMGSGQMRQETNFQGSEFECFGFAGDCGIIVKLRAKLQTLRIKELSWLPVIQDKPRFWHFCTWMIDSRIICVVLDVTIKHSVFSLLLLLTLTCPYLALTCSSPRSPLLAASLSLSRVFSTSQATTSCRPCWIQKWN